MVKHHRQSSRLAARAAGLAVSLFALLIAALPCPAQDAPAAAAQAAEKPKPSRLVTFIIQKPDGTPLANAKIKVCVLWSLAKEPQDSSYYEEYTTDAAGQFQRDFKETTFDEVQLYVEAEGVGCVLTKGLATPRDVPAVEHTVRLKAGGRVVVRVIDQRTGQPLNGVQLAYWLVGDAPVPRICSSAVGRSNAEGQFVFAALPEGEVELVGALDGHRCKTTTVTVADGKTVENVEVKLIRLASLRCRLLKSDGSPLAKSRVRVIPTTQSWSSIATTRKTDDDGNLDVRDLEYETTRLLFMVEDVGYAATETIELDPDKPVAPLTLTLKPGITLSGTTVGRSSGKPIAEVEIWGSCWVEPRTRESLGLRGDFSVASDAEGRWRRAGLPLGEYRIRCHKEDTRGVETVLTVAENKSVADVRLELLEPITVTGVVVTAEGGKPVAKAAVAVGDQKAIADELGRFSLTVTPTVEEEELRLTVEAEGLVSHSQSLTLANGQAPAPLRIELTAGSTIAGLVIDIDTGKPMAGEPVVAFDPDAYEDDTGIAVDAESLRGFNPDNFGVPGTEYRTETDAEGNYSMTVAEAGKYIVVACPRNSLPRASAKFEVVKGATVSVPAIRVTQRPIGYLSGRFLGPDGQPLADVAVAVGARQGNRRIRADLVLRGDRYYVPLTRQGATTFRFAVRGYAMVEHTIQMPDLNVAVEQDLKLAPLKSNASISGRVLLSDGQTPAAGVAMKLRTKDEFWPSEDLEMAGFFDDEVNAMSFSARTDRDGTFRVEDLLPGRYEIVCDPVVRIGSRGDDRKKPEGGIPGHRLTRSQIIKVAESAQVKDVSVTLKPAGAIAGQIVNATTGKPVAGAAVFVYRADYSADEAMEDAEFWFDDSHHARTDEQGKFHLDGLDPGRYSLDVRADGYRRPSSGFWGAKKIQVEAGQTAEHTVRLRPE
jgi:5-hydroxyisourate hydrolase-like protein (transthyretin family)